MPSPFDFIGNFSSKEKYLLESELDEKDYNPFIINRGLSFMSDTVLFANEMNRYWQLDKKLQHDFYHYGIPKGKRFGKWIKKDEENDLVLLISDYFCINKTIAERYIDLLSEEQIQTIKDKMNKGGRS